MDDRETTPLAYDILKNLAPDRSVTIWETTIYTETSRRLLTPTEIQVIPAILDIDPRIGQPLKSVPQLRVFSPPGRRSVAVVYMWSQGADEIYLLAVTKKKRGGLFSKRAMTIINKLIEMLTQIFTAPAACVVEFIRQQFKFVKHGD